MRALGLDLGSKRIGVALSDSSGVLASPYDTVVRSGDVSRDHRRILALADEAEVEVLVVGLPLGLDGGVGPAAQGVLDEVENLRRVTSLPVETYDERLTTVTATRLLREGGVKGKARRQVVDKVAAAVILQSWLDGRADQRPPSAGP
ncbi:Holliday junction resolvase RuvX [Rhabdothermincola salaria]|uniref:Holliday junction resolvase RuvX n=1 Tax=Rhabdothermincola salaria TaxID=2903142 RepID=UPI001E38DB61|nr:Holliday junction resolvase RuvX [Rhabdothermincola salaria]